MSEFEKVKCAECEKEILKKYAIYDSEAGEYVCEDHLENITGYCSVYCQRTGRCDDSC